MDFSFASLVEESGQLIQQEDELPIIEHGAEQIEQVSRKLFSKTQRTLDTTQQAKAHYLLATRGFDAEKYTRNLNSISLATFEPLEPIGDTDIHAYLRHEHEMLILTAIEEAKKNTVAQFHNNYVGSLEAEWSLVKRELEAFRPKNISQQPLPLDVQSGSGLSVANTGSRLSKPMKEYAYCVYLLNKNKLEGKTFQVMSQFAKVADRVDSSRSKKEIVDLWNLLAFMSGEVKLERGKTVLFSHLKDHWKKDYANGPKASLRKAFVAGARKFLGHQYYETIVTRLERRGIRASVTPNPIRDIQDYVLKIIMPTFNAAEAVNLDYDENGVPVWAVIFYCMRCELFEEALQVARKNTKTQDFAVYLEQYLQMADNRPDNSAISKLTSMYKEFHLRSPNQKNHPANFKKAVLNIVCRCDVSPSALEDETYVRNIQDYMWLELALTRERESENINETHYSLHHLQEKLMKWSPSHFKTELTFFHVLILSAQFEAAINYLKDVSAFTVEAIHFAIALHHYGLLRTADFIDSPMFVVAAGLPRVNYAQLVIGYANTFARTDTDDALEYLYLLSDIPAPQSFITDKDDEKGFAGTKSVFHIAFRDLALETHDFEKLLGNSDKAKIRGHIRRFTSNESEIKYLICLIAKQCHSSGKLQDAIELYYMAQDGKKVLELINKELKNVLAIPHSQSSYRVRIADLVDRIDWYKFTDPTLSTQVATLRKLRDCMRFFDLYHQEKYSEALKTLDNINILPVHTEFAGEKEANMKQEPPEIQSNLSEIVLAAMTCLYRLYIQANEQQSSLREKILFEYRERAQALLHFCGISTDKISSVVSMRITSMNGQMM